MNEASFDSIQQETVQALTSPDDLHELRVELWWLENHPEQIYAYEGTEILNQRGHELRQKIAARCIEPMLY